MSDNSNLKNKSTHLADNIGGGLNFQVIIGKILAFLPYFIVSIILSLTIAFFINRYSVPTFLVKGTILIKEKGGRGGGDGADNFLQGMQLLNTSRNIENELGIIQSKFMTIETIKKLDFGISYYAKGSIRKNDLYHANPFQILIDSSHIQVINSEIVLNFLGNNKVEVALNEGSNLFIPKTNEILNIYTKKNTQTYDLNLPIVNEYYSFKILSVGSNKLSEKSGVEFSFKLNSLDNIVAQFAGSYKCKSINKQSTIIEISKEGTLPEKDKAFIDQLCLTYISISQEDKNKVTQNTIKFIDSQLKGIGDTLGKVENEIETFRSINKIVDLSAAGGLIIENISELEKRKADEELKQKYFEYLSNYVQKSNPLNELIAPSSLGIQDAALNSILQKLIELYTKKKTLELSFSEDNPLMLEVNESLNNLKSTLLENLTSIKKSSKILMDDLNCRIKKFEGQINLLPGNEQQLVNLTRKYQLSDKLFTYLMEKRAEAGIAGAGISADGKVIDKSEIFAKISPKNTNNYMIAGVFGVITPLVIILLIEFFNTNIRNHTNLQTATSIPLLGSIVHNDKSTALVIANHPKSQVSEAFRNLRSNLSYLSSAKGNRVLMVTSTISGEGKTFISMNLSSVLAIGGFKTILIGVDLRKPKIFQDFKLDNSFGLTNYLIRKANKDEIIQKTELENLDIVTAGPTPPNPSELIMSDAFYKLIDEYKKVYDFIILDTPPIGLVADGLDIMKHSDIILYVARQNVSKKNFFGLINEIYVNEKVKNIGLVFNDVNFAAVYGYGYGAYGYGYGYGAYGYGYGAYGYGYGYGSYGETDIVVKPLWQRILGR